MVSSIVDIGNAEANATVIQNTEKAVDNHVSQISVNVHGKDERRREKDAIVAKGFERMDVHIVEGLWILVIMMDFVEGAIQWGPMKTNVPIVLQYTLIDMSNEESKHMIRQAVLVVCPIDAGMATHNHLSSQFKSIQG